MQHIHLPECLSTQDYLLDNIQESDLIVSTEKQIAGKGQYGRSWFTGKNAIALSFTIKPNSVLSMTSLEISVILVKFFKERFHLELGVKWPNDLFYKGKKCGGILLHNSQKLVCGIGLNLEAQNEKIPEELKDQIHFLPCGDNIDKKTFSWDLVNYILKNRLEAEKVKVRWSDHCIHLKKLVTVKDDSKITEGIFEGIGDFGQCLIKTRDNQINDLYTGSLIIHN